MHRSRRARELFRSMAAASLRWHAFGYVGRCLRQLSGDIMLANIASGGLRARVQLPAT